MVQFVLIFSTEVETPYDLDRIQHILSTFANITEWSHDLDDDDEILRIVCQEDISGKLIEKLQSPCLKISLLAVFKSISNGIKETHQTIFLNDKI